MTTEGSTGGAPSPADLKAAFKAFRKRLKLTRLDDDSRITSNPLSNSGRMKVVAISPPDGWSQAVWDELVRQGKLKKAGRGMYELVEE